MWAAVIGNMVSFFFQGNYAYKTVISVTDYDIRYFRLFLDVKRGLTVNSLKIIWLSLSLVYYIDFYENGQEEKGFVTMTMLKFQCSAWDLKSWDKNEYRLDFLVRCIWDGTRKTVLQGKTLSLLNLFFF